MQEVAVSEDHEVAAAVKTVGHMTHTHRTRTATFLRTEEMINYGDI